MFLIPVLPSSLSPLSLFSLADEGDYSCCCGGGTGLFSAISISVTTEPIALGLSASTGLISFCSDGLGLNMLLIRP